MFFSKGRLLRLVDAKRVGAAIEAAERRTSGEIRVSVSRYFWGDPRAAAEMAFERLHMQETAERNGVLLFVVPSRKRFVVLGDEGIHARVAPDFWETVARSMTESFRQGDFTGGLEKGIETIGEQLARFFPFDPSSDRNELPNQIDLGPGTAGKPPEAR
jgi:uncharacterized membrane protein